jgi:hypothetical protein
MEYVHGNYKANKTFVTGTLSIQKLLFLKFIFIYIFFIFT